ncbi:MAG: hypothetical protein O2894_05290 [Planctomycetota bacterium]|nr:hypothetical protein [Planctomycetota bacterium]
MLVRLFGEAREELLRTLQEPFVAARLMHGTRALLEAQTTVVTARYVDAPRPGVEVLLSTDGPLPRRVRRVFRRA